MYQCAVSSEAKIGCLTGLDTGEAHLPVKDLPLITPLETWQVNYKIIKIQLARLTISRDSYSYLEHLVVKLKTKRIKLSIFFLLSNLIQI